VQLVDRATNTSTPLVATLSVMAVTEAEMTGSANAQDNIVTGTSADDVLFGLQGNDTLAGNGGNNLFLWMAGDAQSSTGGPVTDVISDFHGWNPLTQTGDRLDISRLLEGLSRQSAWGNYVSVDNHATVAGVTNSTRLTVHVNGTSPGATQVIELPGVTLGTPGESAAALLQELVSTQQLKVL
jgi:Ca2+-binding RTX toxin-like protein